MLAVAAILVVAFAAFWLLREEEEAPREAIPAPAPPAVQGATREPMPTEVADPGEARRLAENQERRARFSAMRDSFASGKVETPASRARLEPAVRALWPVQPPPFRIACRASLCRVEFPAPVAASQAAFAADPGVRTISDEVFLDPDGADPAGYVLLAPLGAAPGIDLLGGVEEEFLRSSEARECLSRVGAVGSVEYTLRVDVSGITYRSSTDLPRPVLECVDDVLNRIIATTEIPREVKTASRTFGLRR